MVDLLKKLVQKMRQKILQKARRSEKEITTLKNLGLKDYELDYLLLIKQKQQAKRKWKN